MKNNLFGDFIARTSLLPRVVRAAYFLLAFKKFRSCHHGNLSRVISLEVSRQHYADSVVCCGEILHAILEICGI